VNPQQWNRINEIFQVAVELRPEERPSFLEASCAGDRILRSEVESLLASDAQAIEFIEEPAVKVAAELLTAYQHGLHPEQQIGSYEVLALIAKGGMGEVYLAQDTKLGRKVAIKLLPSIFTSDGERVRRFSKEARAISALNHPNIIVLHDIVFDGGMHFIVTEFVEGQTLRHRLTETRPTAVESLNIVIQIGSALETAHQAGIIHRDIKPENVMLRPDGYVKVLDFGLAKLTEPHPPDSSDETSQRSNTDTDPGRVMGTVRYMSPEQARGIDVDARTDIFSLGSVLYEIMTGNPPFDGETNSDVICQLLTREPPPLPDSVAKELPELEGILTKALSKDCASRYQSIRELLTDLQQAKHDAENEGRSSKLAPAEAKSGLRASDLSMPSRMMNAVRRHSRRLVFSSALGVVLAAIVLYFTGVKSYPGKDPQTIRDIAVLPFVMESADPDSEFLADGLTDSLIDTLSQLPRVRVIARQSVFRYKGQIQDIQLVARALNVQAVLTGKITQSGTALVVQIALLDAGSRQLWDDRFEEKNNDLIAIQHSLTKIISEKLELRLSREEQQRIMKRYTDNIQAYRIYLKGRYYWNRPTAEDIKQAIDYFNQAIAEDPSYALAYAGLAQSYSLLAANYSYPPETIPLAKAYAKRAMELDDALDEAHYAVALNNYLFDWNWSIAEKEFKLTLELNPGHAAARTSYGGLLRAVGKTDDAIVEVQRALEQDPLSLRIRFGLGLTYYYVRQYQEALKEFRIASQMDPSAFMAYVHLGRCFTALGQFDEALTSLNKAKELSPTNTWTLVSLGQAYAVAGKKSEAERVLSDLLDPSYRAYIRPYEIAMIYAALGDKDRAMEWLSRAYEERSPFLLAMRFEPLLDTLHSDDRFQALLKRIGLND